MSEKKETIDYINMSFENEQKAKDEFRINNFKNSSNDERLKIINKYQEFANMCKEECGEDDKATQYFFDLLKKFDKIMENEKNVSWENFEGGLDKNFKTDDIKYNEIIKR